MRRVEWGWVDKADLPLWWTFVLLQNLWECHHQSSFLQKYLCTCTVGLWTDNSSMAVSYFQQTTCLKWWFALPNLFGGSVKLCGERFAVNRDQWVNCSSDFDAAVCAFYSFIYLFGCAGITFAESSYSNQVWPRSTLQSVTSVDMACLVAIWNMPPRVFISMLMCDKSKPFGLRPISECSFMSFLWPNS